MNGAEEAFKVVTVTVPKEIKESTFIMNEMIGY